MDRCCRIILTALLVVAACPVVARADEVDRYLETQMRQRHLPGLSVAIVRNGHVLKARGYGLADLELRVAATKQTVYELGSVTKQFTAAAIMLLAEEGKLAVEDKVGKYFPEAPATWSGITLRHLLTHTSGIQNHVAVPGFLNVFKTSILSENSPTRDALLRMFFQLPLEFQPGETWSYDNTGYYLLGLVVEQVSGRDFWDFLDARIFRPLGMTATRSTDPRPLVLNRAAGYEWVNSHYENRPVLAPFIGFSAGSLQSSVEDMAKWDAALSAGKLLHSSSFERLWTPARANDGSPVPFNYGFGWFIDSYHSHRMMLHSGGSPGFSSIICRFPDDRLTIILLANHGDRILEPLAIDLAGKYAPALRRSLAGKDPEPKTSLSLREVVTGLLQGSHDAERFTPPMRSFLKTATGKGFWQWLASHGPLAAFDFSDREETGEGRVLRYRVLLGDNHYWMSVTLTRGDRIAQIRCW